MIGYLWVKCRIVAERCLSPIFLEERLSTRVQSSDTILALPFRSRTTRPIINAYSPFRGIDRSHRRRRRLLQIGERIYYYFIRSCHSIGWRFFLPTRIPLQLPNDTRPLYGVIHQLGCRYGVVLAPISRSIESNPWNKPLHTPALRNQLVLLTRHGI